MATPFADTPNSVLRRLLELDGVPVPASILPRNGDVVPHTNGNGKKPKRTRAKKGELDFTPQSKLREPLLKVLGEAEKPLTFEEVKRLIIVEIRLRPDDLRKHEDGTVRWEKSLQFAKQVLVDEGFIDPPSIAGRNQWRLNDKGQAEYRTVFCLQ
jgi:hypothetical protein